MRVLPKTRNNRFGADLNNLAYLMALIGRFLMPEIEARNLHDIWFQQDGAICHTARETMDLLRSRFSKQFISRLGPVDWPPRSCDITPLDFYLWRHVKSKCFVDKPTNIEALDVNITEVISEILTEVLERVSQNWFLRMDELTRSCG